MAFLAADGVEQVGLAQPLQAVRDALSFVRGVFAAGEPVGVDRGLVSSRRPDDLPAFCATIIEELAA